MIKKIQNAGIQILNWNVKKPFDQVINQHLGPPAALMRTLEGYI